MSLAQLNKLSTLPQFVIHEASDYLKFKLNPSQHGFTKSKSTNTNLVTYLLFIIPLVGSHCHVCAIYFGLSNAFDF
jgi:hypothetical protein